ncbi:MAG: endonuclease [Bacilli bacterium]|nr:endonuclease [Bacilli bacterium]
MNKVVKIILISFGSLIGVTVLAIGSFLAFASATELKVSDIEKLQVDGNVTTKIDSSVDHSILSWNIGYGALDENMDCHLDGGRQVYGSSYDKVIENINAITTDIKNINPDMFLLQEIDIDSRRSYNTNQRNMFINSFSQDQYNNTLALNFQAGFIPIPIYSPMGKVISGISTFSKYQVSYAERRQLPIPFSWPMTLFNLKRCLLINRIPIEGSEKELILVNLHLEAYDDGEGKAKQLKVLMDYLYEERNKGNYVIAGGDFNQTFREEYFSLYPKRNDWVCPVIDITQYPEFSFLMDETVPTCRSLNVPYSTLDKLKHQYYMLDGFIVSDNITVNSVQTIDKDFKNTDHNPVLMNFKLN